MKKIVILLSVLAAMGEATVYAADTDSQAQVAVAEMDQCVQVGNVSATVDEGGFIKFINYNSYKVTVNYTVTAFNNGTRVKVGGGTVTLQHTANNGVVTERVASGYSGYAIEISVYKCQ